MDDTRDHQIAALATHQHGVFRLGQAEAVGFTRDQREFRVRAGRWLVPHPGVFRIAGIPESWRTRLLESCWAAQGLAVASHRSAAELWGLPGRRTDLVELTCHRWRRAQASGLVVHETKALHTDDIEAVDGIPTTSVEQTLLGLAAVVHPSTAEMAFDSALRQGLTTAARLEQFVRRKGKKGRNGAGVLRRVLSMHDPLAGMPESAMETKLRQVLRRGGLPMPVFQYVIRDHGRFVARVDAAYPELRIAIEFDSYEHHTGRNALVRDNDRRNQLRRIRWQTVTFTAADLQRSGGPAIEALITARREALPPRSGVTGP
jgi:hypothetical protein